MYRKYIKRLLDIIFGLLLFIITLPFTILTGIIIYIELGFPLLNHRKEKEGKNHKTFIMYKFRTSLPKKTGSDNKVYTKVTRVIDYLKLNELPQLINVIKGDMSIVGPRPFIPNDKTLPKDRISEKRYLVRPGLTGLFQVTGGTHKDKLDCDIYYFDHLSFWLDLKIVLKTPFAIIKKMKRHYNK